jgi:triosephosphate isomerase
MKPPIVGVGMKMYLGYEASLRYLADVARAAPRCVSLFVLPSFPVLPAAGRLLAGTGIAYGAQDGHWEDFGPHTGSVSAAMLAELGCTFVEVGHAERRRDFCEDDAMTARKAAAVARHNLVPIVCVGEWHERDDAVTVVKTQLDPVLEHVEDKPLVVAYEPVWAIGAKQPADAERVGRVVRAVRELTSADILYGGSVVPDEVAGILGAGADGVFASRSMLTLAGLERVVAAATRPRPAAGSPSPGPSPAD